MKKELLYVFTTGGTISTFVDKNGIARVGDITENLISKANSMGVGIEAKSLMKKESANIDPRDWKVIAVEVANTIKKRRDARGIVILHGTDTMHYTAAALSFMIQNPGIPIVMTGSMISGSEPSSDAVSNINAALNVAANSDFGEVCIVFSADPVGKKRKVVMRGNRARKVRSGSLNAFESINAPPLAFVENGSSISYTEAGRTPRGPTDKMKLDTNLEANVVYVKQNPALTESMLDRFLRGANGAVIEGTGKGHLNESLLKIVTEFGKPVAVSTQALYGGENFGNYNIGSKMLKVKNILHARDMTSETALVKLMWCLGHEGSNAKKLFNQNICGEFSLENLSS